MKQTKIESLIESCTNVVIGYWVAIGSQLVIFPLYGVHIPLQANLMVGVWFTFVSFVRSYTLRRWFNSYYHAFVHKVVGAWLRFRGKGELATSSAGASADVLSPAEQALVGVSSANYNGVIRPRLKMQWKADGITARHLVRNPLEAAVGLPAMMHCPGCRVLQPVSWLSCPACGYNACP